MVRLAARPVEAAVRLDSVKQESFDTVFYPGGHGPMWDLAEDKPRRLRLRFDIRSAGHR
jgi:putative intracellular protease/amidase